MPEKIKYGKEIWQTDPDAAFEEARRRCLWTAERAEETWLFLSDLSALERLPQELATLHHITRLDIGDGYDPEGKRHFHPETRPLSAWGPLSALPSLQNLSLASMNISSLDVLANVADLVELDLFYSKVSDISALIGASGLQSLDLRSTKVSDISALSGASGLQSLNLTGTKVSDISALSGASGLLSLYLSGTQVSDISALSGASGLQSLDLRSTKVSDISALSGASGLQSLDLRSTKVSDISALSGASGLLSLYLADTQVSDISALSGASGLQRLDLADTQVSDISALSGASGLQGLDLSHTQVSDISALSGATGLQSLSLAGTQVSDISALLENPAFTSDGPLWLHFRKTPLESKDAEWGEIAELGDAQERSRRAVAKLRKEEAEKTADAAQDMRRAAESQSGAELSILPDGRASLSQAPAGAPYPYQSDAALAREIAAQAENIRVAVATLEPLRSNAAQEIFAPRLAAYLSALSEDMPDILRIRPRWQVLGPAIADDFHRQSLDDGVVALLDEITRQHEVVAKAVEKDDAPAPEISEGGPDPDEDGAAVQPLAEEAAEILSSDKAREAVDDTFAATIVANLEAMNQTLQTRALETERQKAERTRRFRAAGAMILATVGFAGSLTGLTGYNAGEAALYLADKMAPIWQALSRLFM